jgi:hypothetical protein
MQNPEQTEYNPLYNGTTTEITLLSGKKLVIREVNGDDEGILSNESFALEGKHTAAYLSSITEMDMDLNRKPSIDEVLAWPVKDKYFALMMSRIHSWGYNVKFGYICPNCEVKNTYNEDLKVFMPEGTFEDDNIKPSIWAAVPYPKGISKGQVLLTTSSGKNIRYDILNSVGEKIKLDAAAEQRNNNLELTIRNLSMEIQGKYEKVFKFNCFGPKDMMEIRKSIKEMDGSFTPLTLVTCPNCGHKEYTNILTTDGFFYPTEI